MIDIRIQNIMCVVDTCLIEKFEKNIEYKVVLLRVSKRDEYIRESNYTFIG